MNVVLANLKQPLKIGLPLYMSLIVFSNNKHPVNTLWINFFLLPLEIKTLLSLAVAFWFWSFSTWFIQPIWDQSSPTADQPCRLITTLFLLVLHFYNYERFVAPPSTMLCILSNYGKINLIHTWIHVWISITLCVSSHTSWEQ